MKDYQEHAQINEISTEQIEVAGIDLNEVSNAVIEIQETNGKKTHLTNKRIDFDKRTLKRIETMIPVFGDEVGEGASNNEIMSFIIARGIDALFEGDFKRKIDEL